MLMLIKLLLLFLHFSDGCFHPTDCFCNGYNQFKYKPINQVNDHAPKNIFKHKNAKVILKII